MDAFIQSLFSDVLKKMGIEVPKNIKEFRLVIDEQYPVLLNYDAQSEQVIILGMLDVESHRDNSALDRRLLEAGLNPIFGQEPGVGIDQKSGCCFSYMTIPRRLVNTEQICYKIARLVEWGKKILVA